jgi:hypothetical protein
MTDLYAFTNAGLPQRVNAARVIWPDSVKATANGIDFPTFGNFAGSSAAERARVRQR